MSFSTDIDQKELLFLVLSDKKVQMVETYSQQIIFPQQIIQYKSPEAVMSALKYRCNLRWMGKQSEKLKILCIPACQPFIVPRMHKEQQRRVNCLVKIDPHYQKEGQKTVHAFASGRRSAIVINEKQILRYKGCGCDLKGFYVENNQLRGCQFQHTAKRQLIMTKKINQILLKRLKINSANIPIALYRYNDNELKRVNLMNSIEILPKYCCLYETIGDRRLGTHLLSPLEGIFISACHYDENALCEIFKAKKRIDEINQVQQYLLDFQTYLEPGDKFITKQRKIFNNYVLINQLSSILLPLNKQNSICNFISDQKQLLQCIIAILNKIGYEAGEIKRIFCEQGINWGYFKDHADYHCNAHLNNFIVTKPKPNQRYTYPLDFDLAFLKSEFISIEYESEKYGCSDDDLFQQLLLQEYNAMEMSLTGIEIMDFVYNGNETQYHGNYHLMRKVAFRDTLLSSFREGMRGNNAFKDHLDHIWNENISNIQVITRRCFELSQQHST